MESTIQPVSSIPNKLLNNSLRVTNANSPIKDLKYETLGINDLRGTGQMLPILHTKSPIYDQKDNQSMQSSLYARGFRTPVKRNVPYWDAKCIQDSNDFKKEQQMKQLQNKSNVCIC